MNGRIRVRSALARAGAWVAAAACVVGFGSLGDARAEDPPAGAPPRIEKIQSPVLEGLVGHWDVAGKVMGRDLKGVATFSKAVGGTALVHAFQVGPPMAFDGLGVYRVAPDGKALSLWGFDSHGQGKVWKFTGALSAEGFDVVSDEGGLHAERHLKKKDGGFELVETHGPGVEIRVTLTKSEKPVEIQSPKTGAVAEHPFVSALLGDWKVVGESMERTYDGKAAFRLGVGGHYVLFDGEIHGGGEEHHAYSVFSVGDGGRSMRSWWFTNHFTIDPMAIAGALSDKAFEGKGPHPAGGELTVAFAKTDGGFEVVFKMGDLVVMEETYTRPAPARPAPSDPAPK